MFENKIYKPHFLRLFIIAAICLLVYSNSLKGRFLWDDDQLVLNNPDISNARFVSIFLKPLSVKFKNYYRPIQILSYKWDYFFWHFNPFGFHLTNVLIHIINALLVYAIIYIISCDWKAAFFTGSIFSIHPLLSEPVNYISSRSDLLMGLFFLSALFFYIKIKGSLWKNRYFYASLFSFTLAILSKEAALILPLILLIYTAMFLGKEKRRTTPYFAIAILYIIVRVAILVKSKYTATNLAFIPLLLSDIAVIAMYLKLIFLPFDLHKSWIMPWISSLKDYRLTLPFLMLATIAILCGVMIRKKKIFSFGILWFLVLLLPVLNIFFPVGVPLSEAWVYLASIGIFLSVASLLTNIKPRSTRVIFYPLFILIICFYGMLTIKRNELWAGNPIYFYKDILRHNASDIIVHYNLANVCFEQKLYAEAEEEYKRAISLDSHFADAHNSLCNMYVELGKLDQAIDECKEAIKIKPHFYLAHYNLGNAYFDKREYKNAIEAYQKATSLKPDFKEAFYNLELAKQKLSEKKGLK